MPHQHYAIAALFLLVSVFPQTFFTLVGRHLMSLLLFPAWHSFLFLRQLLDFVLYFIDKGLSRLERRNEVFRNNNGSVL
jgi:hypothetical protein